MHETEPFCGDLPAHIADAGDITARPVQARDQPDLHRIDRGAEDDRDRAGGGLGRQSCQATGRNDNYGHAPADQIGGQFGQTIELILSEAVFNRHIAAFDETSLAQTFEEVREVSSIRTKMQISDHWHRPLLRPRRQRPGRGRGAEEGEEGAASHAI